MAIESGKRWWFRVFQVALVIAVMWFILSRLGVGVEELRGVGPGLLDPSWGTLALATVVFTGGCIFGALIWGLIVVGLGGPRLGQLQAARIWVLGSLGRYLPGRVWGVLGVVGMAREAGVQTSTATIATAFAMLGNLAGAMLVGLSAFVAGPPEQRRWGMIALAVGAVLCSLACIPRVWRWGIGMWFRVTRTAETYDVPRGQGLVWIAYHVPVWLSHALAFWIFAAGLGIELPVGTGASAFAAAYLVGYVVVFLPAGLGAREGALILFLSDHAEPTELAALAVAARVWMTAVDLLIALLVWAVGLRRGELSAVGMADRD